jgi:hypothetical protein
LPEGAVADIPQTKEARVASLAVTKANRKVETSEKGATAKAAPAAVPKSKASLTTWLIWGALALAFYFLIVQLTPTGNLETERRDTQQGS